MIQTNFRFRQILDRKVIINFFIMIIIFGEVAENKNNLPILPTIFSQKTTRTRSRVGDEIRLSTIHGKFLNFQNEI